MTCVGAGAHRDQCDRSGTSPCAAGLVIQMICPGDQALAGRYGSALLTCRQAGEYQRCENTMGIRLSCRSHGAMSTLVLGRPCWSKKGDGLCLPRSFQINIRPFTRKVSPSGIHYKLDILRI